MPLKRKDYMTSSSRIEEYTNLRKKYEYSTKQVQSPKGRNSLCDPSYQEKARISVTPIVTTKKQP